MIKKTELENWMNSFTVFASLVSSVEQMEVECKKNKWIKMRILHFLYILFFYARTFSIQMVEMIVVLENKNKEVQ